MCFIIYSHYTQELLQLSSCFHGETIDSTTGFCFMFLPLNIQHVLQNRDVSLMASLSFMVNKKPTRPS